jgi:predicted transcriptional regulator
MNYLNKIPAENEGYTEFKKYCYAIFLNSAYPRPETLATIRETKNTNEIPIYINIIFIFFNLPQSG